MITIKINTDNAAFEDYEQEVVRILRELANSIESGSEPASIRDINGNKCGTVEYD